MRKLFTLAEAARIIGCHKSQTSRKAREFGLGQRVGNHVILTAGEVEKLRKAITPRPRK